MLVSFSTTYMVYILEILNFNCVHEIKKLVQVAAVSYFWKPFVLTTQEIGKGAGAKYESFISTYLYCNETVEVVNRLFTILY